MKIKKTILGDVLLIEVEKFKDQRGFFFEAFNTKKFTEVTKKKFNLIQINESISKYLVARGMHLQKKPYGQNKIIRVVKGKVIDIIFDLRANSPSFMKFELIELDEKSNNMIYIPKGFAHGFISLSSKTIFNYLVDNKYKPSHEVGFNLNDPLLSNFLKDYKFKLSEKDKKLPMIKDLKHSFDF